MPRCPSTCCRHDSSKFFKRPSTRKRLPTWKFDSVISSGTCRRISVDGQFTARARSSLVHEILDIWWPAYWTFCLADQDNSLLLAPLDMTLPNMNKIAIETLSSVRPWWQFVNTKIRTSHRWVADSLRELKEEEGYLASLLPNAKCCQTKVAVSSAPRQVNLEGRLVSGNYWEFRMW